MSSSSCGKLSSRDGGPGSGVGDFATSNGHGEGVLGGEREDGSGVGDGSGLEVERASEAVGEGSILAMKTKVGTRVERISAF